MCAPPLLTTTPGAAGEAVPDDEDTVLDGEPDEALSVDDGDDVGVDAASSLGVVESVADELADDSDDDSDPDGPDGADGSATATPAITTATIPNDVASDVASPPIRARSTGSGIAIWIVGGPQA